MIETEKERQNFPKLFGARIKFTIEDMIKNAASTLTQFVFNLLNIR